MVLGLGAGMLARLVIPGSDSTGWITTMIIGIIGAFVGGWIARETGLIAKPVPGEWIPGVKSVISATVGALVFLATIKVLKPREDPEN